MTKNGGSRQVDLEGVSYGKEKQALGPPQTEVGPIQRLVLSTTGRDCEN